MSRPAHFGDWQGEERRALIRTLAGESNIEAHRSAQMLVSIVGLIGVVGIVTLAAIVLLDGAPAVQALAELIGAWRRS